MIFCAKQNSKTYGARAALCLVFCLIFGQSSYGITGSEGVRYLVVAVNGQRRLVRTGETFQVIWGDRIRIIDVGPQTGVAQSVDAINFVGFGNLDKRQPRDDRGYLIETTRRLNRSYSLAKDGQKYAIQAEVELKLVAEFFVEILDPRFEYAVVEVDGRPTILRNGQELRLSPDSTFKVRRVRTNVRDGEDIHFQIVEVRGFGLKSGEAYEIRFTREDKILASIPVRVLTR